MAQPAEQAALLPAAHVKFTGMSGSALAVSAELGDEQTFTVKARCVGHARKLRKDDEVRVICDMEIIDVTFGPVVKADRGQQLQLVDELDPLEGDD
jgi:hypothetical protein